MKIRIILTCVGGLVTPSMIKSLKENKEDEFYIVGVDMKKDAVGFYFTDKSYVVPHGESIEYPGCILQIALKEKIDVVVPLSEEETLGLSRNKAFLESKGIVVACSDYLITKVVTNKATMLQFLKENNFPVPEFRVPHNLTELEKDIKSLGYPKKSVVFKPQRAHGARGFWIVRKDFDKRKMILGRIRQQIPLEWLLESLDDNKPFPEVILMEYLAGKDFNVDILAKQGKSLYIMPNERIVPDAGPVQVGLVKKNEKVEEVVRQIIEIFKFDFWVNVEVAFRNKEDGYPLVYEINPHVSAPIVVNKAAGIDLLSLGIKLALGKEIDCNLQMQKTKMICYRNEYFI